MSTQSRKATPSGAPHEQGLSSSQRDLVGEKFKLITELLRLRVRVAELNEKLHAEGLDLYALGGGGSSNW